MKHLLVPVLALVGLLGLLSGDALGKKIMVGPNESVQAALDAASPGDTIVVKGVHHENLTISLPAVTLRGDGGTIDGQYLGPCITVTADDVTVEELTLLHATLGIFVDADRARIEGTTIRNASDDSIGVYGDDAVIRKNDILDGGGIFVEANTSTSFTRLEENELFRCGSSSLSSGAFVVRKNELTRGRGISVTCDHPTITTKVLGNDLSQIDGTGINVSSDHAGPVRIESNDLDTIDGVGISFDVDGAGDALIRKNKVEDVHQEGFEIDHNGTGVVTIRQNVVTDSRDIGFYVYGSSAGTLEVIDCKVSSCEDTAFDVTADDGDVLLSGLEVRDAKQDGVTVYDEDPLGDTRVLDCDIRDVIGSGVVAEDYDASIRVEGCRIQRCTSNGIECEASAPILVDNIIKKCGSNGIRIDADVPAAGGGVIGNDIRKCGGDGVLIYDAISFVVEANVCRDNHGDGIDVRAGSATSIVDNVCRKNLHEGIDNSAVGTSIDGNTCLGNGSGLGPDIAGIGKGSGSVGTFIDNEFATGDATTAQRLDQ